MSDKILVNDLRKKLEVLGKKFKKSQEKYVQLQYDYQNVVQENETLKELYDEAMAANAELKKSLIRAQQAK